MLVPIKRGLNFSYALESFQEIVAFHKGETNKNKLGGDLGGELEVEDFDNTQEYIIDDGKKKIKLSNDEMILLMEHWSLMVGYLIAK